MNFCIEFLTFEAIPASTINNFPDREQAQWKSILVNIIDFEN